MVWVQICLRVRLNWDVSRTVSAHPTSLPPALYVLPEIDASPPRICGERGEGGMVSAAATGQQR